MKRLPCWQCNLSVFLVANRLRPFSYGQWDCCLFVYGAVEAMTGVDIAAPYRGRYDSRESARRLVGPIPKITEQLMQEHGASEVPVLRAQRGDIALLKDKRAYMLGLIDLNGQDIITTSPQGLWRVPLPRAVRCWRI